MKYLLPLFLLTISCGDFYLCESEWYEVAGLDICDNGFDVHNYEIKQAVKTLQEKIVIHYPEIIEIEEKFREHRVSVTFTDRLIAMDCKLIETGVYACETIRSGLNINGMTNYVYYNDCLSATPFVHELLHSIERIYIDGPLGDHDTPYFFPTEASTPDDLSNSINRIVDDELMGIFDRCPKE